MVAEPQDTVTDTMAFLVSAAEWPEKLPHAHRAHSHVGETHTCSPQRRAEKSTGVQRLAELGVLREGFMVEASKALQMEGLG